MFELEQTGDSRDHMIAQMDAAIRQLKGELADLGRQIQTQEMARAFTLSPYGIGNPYGTGSPYGTGGVFGNAPTGDLLVPGVSNLNLPSLDLSNPRFEAAEISLDKRAKPKKK